MKKYYIVIDGVRLGPLTIDEVKGQHPDADTLVWFEGLDGWMPMSNVVELADCLPESDRSLVPPPLPTFTAQHRPSATTAPCDRQDLASDSDEETPQGRWQRWLTVLRTDKVKIISVLSVAAVAIVAMIVAGQQFSDHRLRQQMEAQSRRAEQFKREQAELEIQRQAEAEQREAERRRKAEIEAQQLRQHIEQLKNDRTIIKRKLDECVARLRKAEEFHFLRTSGEKQREINAILAERNSYLNQLSAIDAELKSYDAS
ncbi:MAG: DUF4339 domain-containing protein [Bacteroidales bacterium]|nr:DUF4339 domain-containing protein [Bacteroidales bacterium]